MATHRKSERKSAVLVMAESKPAEPKRKGQKNRKVGHQKMKVIMPSRNNN